MSAGAGSGGPWLALLRALHVCMGLMARPMHPHRGCTATTLQAHLVNVDPRHPLAGQDLLCGQLGDDIGHVEVLRAQKGGCSGGRLAGTQLSFSNTPPLSMCLATTLSLRFYRSIGRHRRPALPCPALPYPALPCPT